MFETTYDKETVKYWYESIKFIVCPSTGVIVSMWCRAGREVIEIETLGL
jgi:hypothetical protein